MMSVDMFGYSNYGDLSDPFIMVFVIIWLIFALIAMALGVTMYILQSVGLYGIAKRRGIHYPGLAWVPVANMWILGSISDQYQYVVKGKVRSRRKVLLGLMIAVESLTILFLLLAFSILFGIGNAAMRGHSIGAEAVLPVIGIMGAYLIMMVVAIIASVFQYIACYDLFNSCNPGNAVLFLVLAIFFNFLMPFFIFACRKKDEGMPPRKIQVPVAPWTPAPPPAPTCQSAVSAEPAVDAPAEEPAAEEPETEA